MNRSKTKIAFGAVSFFAMLYIGSYVLFTYGTAEWWGFPFLVTWIFTELFSLAVILDGAGEL